VKRILVAALLAAVFGMAIISPESVSAETIAKTSPLNPISLSFSSPRDGYMLSLYDCARHTCANLRSTNDAGSTWSEVPIPSQLNKSLQLASWDSYGASYDTLTIHFGDARDGWIYGTIPVPDRLDPAYPNMVSRLWSTHNGGRTWRRIRLGPLRITLGVAAMATHGPWTYLFGGTNTSARSYILGTHSNVDQWTVKSKGQMGSPAGGTQLEGAFSFSGSKGWFVAGNDRGFTASARLCEDGSWQPWSGPTVDSAAFAPIAVVSSNVLLIEGQSAGFVIPPASTVPRGWNNEASWLFISHNAGTTFKPYRQLSSSYRGGYSTAPVPGLPATPIPGVILLQRTVRNAYELLRSSNWGRTWQVALKRSVSQVVFTSRSVGFAIVQRRSSPITTTVLRTNDSGIHWSDVHNWQLFS
jgi:hypothetical protein